MKLPKGLKSFITVITVIAVFLTTAFAATTSVEARELVYGVRVSVNGVVQEFDHDMRPFIMDGRTFLPIRGIAEALGANVDFDPNLNMVYVSRSALPPMVGHAIVGRWSMNLWLGNDDVGWFFNTDGTGYQWGPGVTLPFVWSTDQNRLTINHRVSGQITGTPSEYIWEISNIDPISNRRYDSDILALSDGAHGAGLLMVLGRRPYNTLIPEQTASGTMFFGVHVVANGVYRSFAHDMRPFIMDGRTFLPVRGIADALGLEVDFDDAANMVILNERAVPTVPPQGNAEEPLETFRSDIVGKWSSETITYIFYPSGRARRGSTAVDEEFRWSPFRDNRVRFTAPGSAPMYRYTITGNVLTISNGDSLTLVRDTTGQNADDLIGKWDFPPLFSLGIAFNADGTGYSRINETHSYFTWTMTEPGMVRMVHSGDGFVPRGTENRFFVVEGNSLSLLRYEPPYNVRATYVRR